MFITFSAYPGLSKNVITYKRRYTGTQVLNKPLCEHFNHFKLKLHSQMTNESY